MLNLAMTFLADPQVVMVPNTGKIIMTCVMAVCAVAAGVLYFLFPNHRKQIALSLVFGGLASLAIGVFFFYRFLDDKSDASGISGAILVVIGIAGLATGGVLHKNLGGKR